MFVVCKSGLFACFKMTVIGLEGWSDVAVATVGVNGSGFYRFSGRKQTYLKPSAFSVGANVQLCSQPWRILIKAGRIKVIAV